MASKEKGGGRKAELQHLLINLYRELDAKDQALLLTAIKAQTPHQKSKASTR